MHRDRRISCRVGSLHNAVGIHHDSIIRFQLLDGSGVRRKINTASISPFSSIGATRPFLISNRPGCTAAVYRNSPYSEFKWTYAAVTNWSCVLPNKAEFMPDRKRHGISGNRSLRSCRELDHRCNKSGGNTVP